MFLQTETPPQSPKPTIDQIKTRRTVEFNRINRMPEITQEDKTNKQQAFIAFIEAEINVIMGSYGIPAPMTTNQTPKFRFIPETNLYFKAKSSVDRLQSAIDADVLDGLLGMDISNSDSSAPESPRHC